MLRSSRSEIAQGGRGEDAALPEAERILSLGITIIRFGVLAQVISGTVRGAVLLDEAFLYVALASFVAVESLILIAALLIARRPLLKPWGLVDVATGFAMMMMMPLALPGAMLSDTWIWWASSLAINTIGNFGATSRSIRWVAVASVGMSVVYILIATNSADVSLLRATTESLNYPIFGFGVLLVSRFLRDMAARADADRRVAVEAMRQSELNRARLVIHDASSLLRLLGDPATPATIVPALQKQARQEAAHIRAFLAEPRSPRALLPASLGELIDSVAEGFTDLPLEFAIDLGSDALISDRHAPALGRALGTVLHNVRRHAYASQVVIHADLVGPRWEVSVRDDGVGFDRSEQPLGFGLASQVVGELTELGLEVAISSAAGQGTAVRISGPCESREATR